MGKARFLPLIISVFSAFPAHSQLFDGKSLVEVSLSEVAGQIRPGTVVLLGERHALQSHQRQHLLFLNELRKSGHKISVGLEFVNYTDQLVLNDYRQQKIDENQFLEAIGWGGFSFGFYREQLNFPDLSRGELSLGLNLPRAITSRISRNGLGALTPEERALLPADFALGRDSYRRRFMTAAGAHCKSPENCFTAQCAWDDTMARTATDFLNENPDHILVIVVGEFHVQYGGGLGHRILQRRPNTVIVSLSQIWSEGMSEDELMQELQPSPEEGPRADYIWVSRP